MPEEGLEPRIPWAGWRLAEALTSFQLPALGDLQPPREGFNRSKEMDRKDWPVSRKIEIISTMDEWLCALIEIAEDKGGLITDK